MTETPSSTESLLDIIRGINSYSIMLPEFQRDFRWELEQTYDLFDSLIRGIFVGTIIYGKPSFEMTLREIDARPRKGKGSNAPLKTLNLTQEEINQRGQTHNLRIVLDGQQRLTSVYRAMTGIDNVYLHLGAHLIDDQANVKLSLEEMLEGIAGEESSTYISIKLNDAYRKEVENLEDDDLKQIFSETAYYRKALANASEDTRRLAERIYRRGVNLLLDLYKQQKMMAYYLLDMSLDKFCIFFERSNSRGIQLNFTDILAAKLYQGFNLRKKIEDFESDNKKKIKLNREIVVRAIAAMSNLKKIDKSTILKELNAASFDRYWDEACALYAEALDYLISQHYIISQSWMPSENMLIPLMMFRREIKGFDQMNEVQRKFIEFWYWASIFSNRYSGASNEVILLDKQVLIQVAKGEKINGRGFFNKMRSLIQEPDDLFSYTKKTSTIYKGVLNLLNYYADGLMDWNNKQKIGISMDIEDHHIYPRAYIYGAPRLDSMEQPEAEQLVDCVVNRTLMPKLTNITVGKRAPKDYLHDLLNKNPNLEECISTHLLPTDMIKDEEWNTAFKLFLDERASRMFNLIDEYVIEPFDDTVKTHTHGDENEEEVMQPSTKPARLKHMVADGRVQIGEEVFVRQHPHSFAKIISAELVEYEGNKYPINSWGQKMTGWSSISIYESVLLKRTGQPLGRLRQ
jgi:hypothetical protein